MAVKKFKELPVKFSLINPTWDDVRVMATEIQDVLGKKADSHLHSRSFYTLCVLANLMKDSPQMKKFIFEKI